jgi:hypothetical protein
MNVALVAEDPLQLNMGIRGTTVRLIKEQTGPLRGKALGSGSLRAEVVEVLLCFAWQDAYRPEDSSYT